MPNYLKLLALLYVILSLVIAVFFSGCSGPIIAEIAEGVTEGAIEREEEHKTKRIFWFFSTGLLMSYK